MSQMVWERIDAPVCMYACKYTYTCKYTYVYIHMHENKDDEPDGLGED